MPPLLDARIPVRNRRQAMDWSLVLASQGIEHIIEHEDAGGWSLAVKIDDLDSALAHIRLYRLENRHGWWHRPVFQTDWFFDGSSLVWVLLTIIFYWWSKNRADLRTLGMMDVGAVAHGERWHWFTATLMHVDVHMGR